MADKIARSESIHYQWRIPLVNALRYRANIYFTGPPAFHEDDWKKARIGSTNYHISCRTTRCKLPNVDPETGVADPNEPSTTMRKYRVIDEGSKNAARRDAGARQVAAGRFHSLCRWFRICGDAVLTT